VHSGDWVFRFGVVGWVVLVSFELFACIYLSLHLWPRLGAHH